MVAVYVCLRLCVCVCASGRECVRVAGCARVYVCACVAMLERPGGGGLRRKNGKQYAWYLPAQHTIDAGFFLPGGKEQSAMHGGCVCMCVRTFVCLCVCASGRVRLRVCPCVRACVCICVAVAVRVR